MRRKVYGIILTNSFALLAYGSAWAVGSNIYDGVVWATNYCSCFVQTSTNQTWLFYNCDEPVPAACLTSTQEIKTLMQPVETNGISMSFDTGDVCRVAAVGITAVGITDVKTGLVERIADLVRDHALRTVGLGVGKHLAMSNEAWTAAMGGGFSSPFGSISTGWTNVLGVLRDNDVRGLEGVTPGILLHSLVWESITGEQGYEGLSSPGTKSLVQGGGTYVSGSAMVDILFPGIGEVGAGSLGDASSGFKLDEVVETVNVTFGTGGVGADLTTLVQVISAIALALAWALVLVIVGFEIVAAIKWLATLSINFDMYCTSKLGPLDAWLYKTVNIVSFIGATVAMGQFCAWIMTGPIVHHLVKLETQVLNVDQAIGSVTSWSAMMSRVFGFITRFYYFDSFVFCVLWMFGASIACWLYAWVLQYFRQVIRI